LEKGFIGLASGFNLTKVCFYSFSDFQCKASVFVTFEKNSLTIKWPRLKAKNGKNLISKEQNW